MTEVLRHLLGLIKALTKLFPDFDKKIIENLRDSESLNKK
jgi:hypothetical protein